MEQVGDKKTKKKQQNPKTTTHNKKTLLLDNSICKMQSKQMKKIQNANFKVL